MNNNYVCKLLKDLRIKSNFTQAYIGKALLGKNQTYYSRLERGEEELTIEEAKILAKEYKISLKCFFEEESEIENIKEKQNEASSLKEHLIKCVKDDDYFKLFRAYITICQKHNIDPEL